MNWFFKRIALFRMHCTMVRWAFIGGMRLTTGRLFVLRDAPLSVLVFFSREDTTPKDEAASSELWDRFQQSARDELKLRMRNMERAIQESDVEKFVRVLCGD